MVMVGRPSGCVSILARRRPHALIALDSFDAWRTRSISLRRCIASLPPTSSRNPLPTRSSQPRTWIDTLPASWRPYALLTRIDKPIGTVLLFLPCGWSIALASYTTQASPSVMLGTTALFATGALVMRGAGCTINDMWDRRLDGHVDRTKDRPLARGDITMPRAVAFLGAQLTVGLGVLVQLNMYSIALGAASLGLVVVYPLMKRVTYWPQVVLGLAFNWGALLGWSAVAGSVDWRVALPLYAGGVCWTLLYDTIYAHQDKLDDARVGIRSTALLFGERSRAILTGFGASSLALVGLSGHLAGATTPFFLGLAAGGIQMGRALFQTDFDDRASCWRGFVGCGWGGFWIWVGTSLDYALMWLI